jgi:hypothetical protein
MFLYTFTWSSRSSAGTLVVIDRDEVSAWLVACSYFARDELSLDGHGEPVNPGMHVLVTTEQRPL